jgi:metallophosphoesterase superfamily enzyme
LRHWREQHAAMQCVLVRGNHDLRAGDPPPDLNIEIVNEPYLLGPFALQHIPKPHITHHVIAGHVHPTFRLIGKGRQRLILPCFYQEQALTLLPSFGDFTGGYAVAIQPDAKIYVTDGGCVWSVKTAVD